MEEYLLECDVLEMDLRIPREHGPALVELLSTPGAGGGPSATLTGDELRVESSAGRLVFGLHGGQWTAEGVEMLDGDRAGNFFGQVVVSLFLSFGGRLRARLRWANPRFGTDGRLEELWIEDGQSNWERPSNARRFSRLSALSERQPAAALPAPAAAAPVPARPASATPAPATPVSAASQDEGEGGGGESKPPMDVNESAVEEALAKLQEAKRHWAEYQRLREERREKR